MKTIIILMFWMCFLNILNAQKWSIPIFDKADSTKVKTLSIKPGRYVIIRSMLIETDSLKFSRRFEGTYIGYGSSGLNLRLKHFYEYSGFSNGVLKQTYTPGKQLIMPQSADSGLVNIKLNEIDFISIRNQKLIKPAGLAEGAVFTSLFAVVLSPLFCINYKNGSFNAERYKYLGVGSAAALTLSFGLEIVFNHSKEYQFKTDWPYKKKRVWRFKSNLQ